MSDDVLEQAKQVIKTYELADKHPNSLIFGNNYMAALVHAPDIARALIETQKRLDEAVKALEYEAEQWCDCTAYGRAQEALDKMKEIGCEADPLRDHRTFKASIVNRGRMKQEGDER